GLTRHLLQWRERVDRQLLEHPVAGEIGDDAADLVGRELAGDPGEVRYQPRHGAAAVHEPGELGLLGGEPQIAGAVPVRRTEHDVRDAAGTGQFDLFDAGAEDRAGPRRVHALRDGGPESWVRRTERLPGRAPRQRLPHADPGFDDGHAGNSSSHTGTRADHAPTPGVQRRSPSPSGATYCRVVPANHPHWIGFVPDADGLPPCPVPVPPRTAATRAGPHDRARATAETVGMSFIAAIDQGTT